MVSAVPVVSVVSFRWFRFGVSGFSTCLYSRQVFLDKWGCQGKLASVNEA